MSKIRQIKRAGSNDGRFKARIVHGNFMRARPKIIFLAGIVLAILLSAAVTIPYVSAWMSYLQSREMNVVSLFGETRMLEEDVPNSIVNITMIAIYPKAAVESQRNMFVMDLAFLVILGSNITEFVCDEIEAFFTHSYERLDYLGRATGFYHYSSLGKISPFVENVSVPIDAGLWPPFPQDASHMLYFADRFNTLPALVFHGRFLSADRSGSVLGVFFNMTKYTTTIYRFNSPITLWIVYAGSLLAVVAVSVNLLYNYQQQKSPKRKATNTSII